jgi:uncharacterized membrane protein
VQARDGSWAEGVTWSLWAAIGFLVLAFAFGLADRRGRSAAS